MYLLSLRNIRIIPGFYKKLGSFETNGNSYKISEYRVKSRFVIKISEGDKSEEYFINI